MTCLLCELRAGMLWASVRRRMGKAVPGKKEEEVAMNGKAERTTRCTERNGVPPHLRKEQ